MVTLSDSAPSYCKRRLENALFSSIFQSASCTFPLYKWKNLGQLLLVSWSDRLETIINNRKHRHNENLLDYCCRKRHFGPQNCSEMTSSANEVLNHLAFAFIQELQNIFWVFLRLKLWHAVRTLLLHVHHWIFHIFSTCSRQKKQINFQSPNDDCCFELNYKFQNGKLNIQFSFFSAWTEFVFRLLPLLFFNSSSLTFLNRANLNFSYRSAGLNCVSFEADVWK